MKKLLTVLLSCVMVLGLMTACYTAMAESAIGMPNPMTEIIKEELPVPMNVPENAQEVKYFSIDGDNTIYEMQFELDGVSYTFRAMMTSEIGAFDMSGMYYTDWETNETKVSYCNAVAMTCQDASVVYWMDIVPGINYTLASGEAVEECQLLEVAEAVFSPAQGDAGPDFMGYFVNEEGHYVKVSEAKNGTTDVVIRIKGLPRFYGKGEIKNGALKFVFYPGCEGREIEGYFFIAEDGTYSVDFVVSHCGLMKSGSEFTGFTPAM